MNSEDERKKKKEEQKKLNEQQQIKGTGQKKNKGGKVDYDQMFEARLNNNKAKT